MLRLSFVILLPFGLAAVGCGDGGTRRADGADADADADTDADADSDDEHALVCTDEEMPFDAGVDGGLWQPLRDVWGVPDGSDVFAVGEAGWILRSVDGGAWTRSESGVTSNLNGVSGRSPECVYAVGDGGVLLRLGEDTTSWVPVETGTGADLFDVWVDADCSAFVVGDGVIRHYADGEWSEWESPIAEPIVAVSGSPEGLFAVGGPQVLGFDGAGWSVVDTAVHSFTEIWVDPAGWAVAAGEGGEISTNLGGEWQRVEWSGGEPLEALWGTTLLDVYLWETAEGGEGGRLLRYDGTAFASKLELSEGRYVGLWGWPGWMVLVGSAEGAQGAALKIVCEYEDESDTED
jgi:hypothetical protein